jgi:hypothetical protein
MELVIYIFATAFTYLLAYLACVSALQVYDEKHETNIFSIKEGDNKYAIYQKYTFALASKWVHTGYIYDNLEQCIEQVICLEVKHKKPRTIYKTKRNK